MEFISDPDKPKKWDSQSDSGQNSLEYWDYSMELEILNGSPQHDLRIAAELGKTLLEANKTLELELKESLSVNDEQAKEIEYLTKQTAALREANDSRLRIYEHLDDAVQDLERTNQRLIAESALDKKKTKSLLDTIEQLESKNEELHKGLEEARSEANRGRHRKKSPGNEIRQNCRRSISCEHSNQQCIETAPLENDEYLDKIKLLEQKLKETQAKRMIEIKNREDLEVELACQIQDNKILREQLAVYHEREVSLRSIDEELTSLDDSTSLCRKCHGSLDETGSNYTMQDVADELEDADDRTSLPDSTLDRLHSGGYAWGSQESMASVGQAMNPEEAMNCGSLDEQPPSLLSELDTQYGLLIEKYKGMVEEHEQQLEAKEKNVKSKEQVVKRPKFGLMDMKCERCESCNCHMVIMNSTSKSIMEELSDVEVQPKSLMEELSEVETSSSGFSEGENRVCHKYTQTEVSPSDDLTPTAPNIDLTLAASNESQIPEYRRLLHLVYYNVKQVVDKDKGRNESEIADIPAEKMETEISSESKISNLNDEKPERPSTLDVNGSRSSSRHRKQKKKQAESKENINTNPSRSVSRKRSRRNQVENCVPKSSKESGGCEHKKKKSKSKNRSAEKHRNTGKSPQNDQQYSRVTHPSVEVAKLIKLEMTYAEALKKASQRPLTHRNK